MGWCSGTVIFDVVADALLGDKVVSKEAVLEVLITALEDGDWDCQQDSEYWEHPLVRKIFAKIHPDWFDDEGNEA